MHAFTDARGREWKPVFSIFNIQAGERAGLRFSEIPERIKVIADADNVDDATYTDAALSIAKWAPFACAYDAKAGGVGVDDIAAAITMTEFWNVVGAVVAAYLGGLPKAAASAKEGDAPFAGGPGKTS